MPGIRVWIIHHGQPPDPSHRRRVASVKVLLSLRLFSSCPARVVRHSPDPCPEIPFGTRRKQTANKGAEQGVMALPPPAARLCARSPAVTLLYIASLIPAGKLRIVPGELPRFWDLLPLFLWGPGQKRYNGARYGPGFFRRIFGVIVRHQTGGRRKCLRRRAGERRAQLVSRVITCSGPGLEDTSGRGIRLPMPWCRSTRAGDGILRRARSPGSSTGPLLSLRTRSGRVCRRALLARSSQSGAPCRSGRSCSTSCRSPGSLRCPREHFHGGVS